MRIFGNIKEWVSTLLQKLGMEEGIPIESKMVSRRIEAAQKAVEAQDFAARKHLLEYDDVMNKQRLAVYGLRDQLLDGLDQKDLILEDYVADMLAESMNQYMPANMHPEQWDYTAFRTQVLTKFGVDLAAENIKLEEMGRQEIGDTVFDKLKERYNAKEALIGAETMRYHERMIMLSVIDAQWKDHLLNMDHLKEGISLRGYGQKDPLVEYKRESFEMFEEMMKRFQEETTRYLYLMQVVGGDGTPVGQPTAIAPSGDGDGNGARRPAGDGQGRHRSRATSIDEMEEEFQRRKRRELEQARMAGGGEQQQPVQRVVRTTEKVRPNEPCPCGSGKKYKKCHGIDS